MSLINGPSADTLKALETAPSIYLVLSPDLYILTASDLYLEATETSRERIVGKHIFEAFPDNPELPGTDGVHSVRSSLQEVLRTKKPHQIPVIRYDVPDDMQPGKFKQRYWHPSHTPVLNEQGEIAYIIQQANNVTDRVLAENALAESSKNLHRLNNKLDDANREIEVTNKELVQTVEALWQLNQNLEKTIEQRTIDLATANEELMASNEELLDSNEELLVARQQVEQAEMQLRLAVEAAKIGSWSINPETKALVYNATLAKIFGYEGALPMTYEQAIGQVVEEHRSVIIKRIEEAIATGGEYDITYAQQRFNDGEVIWLRSLGKITLDDRGENTLFSGVVMDITEQKKDEQRKNDFIGMVSHELKTPLTSLSAYIQMLYGRASKNEDVFTAGALEKAKKQIGKMNAMINGFLNVSRLESGKIHIDKQQFDMAELMKEIEEEALSTISSHTIIFAPVEPIIVYADRDKIGQVINNLISNAVKYSPMGKTINVACLTVENKALVSVKDEGMGISDKDKEKLFERFYRVEAINTKHISGFGIGLYLSSEIILRHNGKIWVESEAGKGSAFYFSLPIE